MKAGKAINEFSIAALVLLVLVCGFLYKPLFVHHNIVPFDIISEFDDAAPEKAKAQNYLLSDVLHQFYPAQVFAQKEIREGRMPWINPHQFGGIAFLADPQNRLFEFTHILLLPFGASAETTLLASAIITLTLTGFFMFGFLRAMRLSIGIAYAGAIAWMFSGPMIVWLQYPLVSTALWIPGVLWALTKILRDKEFRFVILLGAGIFFQALGGQPQMLAISALVYFAYGLYLFFSNSERHLKIGASVITICVLAISSTLFLLGPATSFIKNSVAYERGRGDARSSVSQVIRGYATNPMSTGKTFIKRIATYGVVAALPNWYGNPVTRNFRFPENSALNNYSEIANYAGLMMLALAAASLYFIKKPHIQFWLVTGVVSFALSAKLPIFELAQYLPLLGKIHFGRFRFIFVFSIICLACVTLQKLLHSRSIRIQTIMGSVFAIVCAVDVCVAFSGYNPGAEKQIFVSYKNSLIVQTIINSHHGGIIGLGAVGSSFRAPLIPNMATALGVDDIRGSNPVITQDIAAYAQTYMDYKGSYVLASTLPEDADLEQAGIGTVVCELSRCAAAFPRDNWDLLAQNEQAAVYVNKTILLDTVRTLPTKPRMTLWIVLSAISLALTAAFMLCFLKIKTKPPVSEL